ncbi:hypothetical protein EBZ37_01475 [bacterium]|nr:hypothetical protein [bacterium]
MGVLKDRVSRNGFFLVALVAFLSVSASAVWADPPPGASPVNSASATPSASNLQEALRHALNAARAKMGVLPPWQQLLFSSEVLPQAENFVREYRPQGSGYRVDVDEGMLQNYLVFFGPKVLGNEKPLFIARVEAQANCEFCAEALPSVKRLLESRFAARGITLSWTKDHEVRTQATSAKPKGEFQGLVQLQALQASRQLDGSVALRVERATHRDDESGLEIQSEDHKFRMVFGVSAGKYTEVRSVEFAATDSTENSSKRLIVEAMSSLGSKVRETETRSAARPAGQELPEVLLKISGVRDYFSVVQLKNQVQLALGELELVSERRLLKGSVVLAVNSKLKPADLKTKLNGLAVGAGKLNVNEVLEGDSVIELEADIR